MEPMTLGSPSGSPAQSGVLPGFLMGDPAVAAPGSKTTFSPTKKTLNFGQSPNQSAHEMSFNRSAITSPTGAPPGQSRFFKYHPTAHDTSSTAPPTISLFDSLREERHQTPSSSKMGASVVDGPLNSSNTFNSSRLMSPNTSYFNDSSVRYNNVPSTNFWVTVFGFPSASISTILSHFSQCGTIVDKMFPQQNGNWIHLRFSSRMECDKALNYNGKIIANSLMIGVLACTDANVTMEDTNENREPVKLRSLSRVTYETAQSPTRVDPEVFAPTSKKPGIISTTVKSFLGW